MKLGTENVNVIVDVKDLSTELLSYIEDRTRCYVRYARFNRDEVSKIGLQVYKDYYTCLAVVYENSGETHWVGIGNLFNICSDNFYVDLGGYDNKVISKEVAGILSGNYKVVYNPEYEELQDAIASGDSEWVDSIVGDRDLAELI